MCRRALSDAQTGMHTLVDDGVELRVRLPGPRCSSSICKLRGVAGPSALTLDVLGPALTDDGAADPTASGSPAAR